MEPLLEASILDHARFHLEREARLADFGPHQANDLGDAPARHVDLVRVCRPQPAPCRGHDVMPAGHGDERARALPGDPGSQPEIRVGRHDELGGRPESGRIACLGSRQLCLLFSSPAPAEVGVVGSEVQGRHKDQRAVHRRIVCGDGGEVRGLVCWRAIAAAGFARPLLEGIDALPEAQRLAQHGDLHHPPAALVEVGVRYAERGRAAAVIARSRGLEQGLDIGFALGSGLLWPRATAQARGRKELRRADQFLRMVERLADRGFVPSILLLMAASTWSMRLSLGAVGVAVGVAPCLSIKVAYVCPSGLRTPLL